MISGGILAVAALVAAGSPAATALEGGHVVGGSERTVFRLSHPEALPDIPDHRAAGWRQRVLRRTARTAWIEVVAEPRPLGEVALWPPAPPAETDAHLFLAPGTGGLEEVARRTVSGAEDAYEAVLRLLVLTGRRVRDLEDPSSDLVQDAPTVWNTGRGTCIGRANLAVALLRAAGVPARTVHGLRFDAESGAGVHVSPAILHRWTEARFPSAGWVPSDPASRLLHLDASYLVLDLGEAKPAPVDPGLRGLRIHVVDRRGALRPTDLADPSLGLQPDDAPVVARTPERTAATLEVRTRPGREVNLWSQGRGLRRRADETGHAVFLGLDPGLYRLEATTGRRTLLVSGTEVLRARLP